MEARAAVEEDMMTRVPLSRQEVKKLKAQQRAGLSTGGFFDDFAGGWGLWLGPGCAEAVSEGGGG
jgi:hypothetical protein